MNYFHTNDPPQGEICFYGSSIMPGYYKQPQKTAESLSNGWLFSGDVGQVYPNGSIKVIDRAKNIFKLSQGEYIAPEKLENIFVQSGYVMQAWIYGDSSKDYIIGFFVCDPEAAKKFATSKNIEVNDELMENNDLRTLVYEDILRLCKDNSLSSLEKPKQFNLIRVPFSVESDILTPTMKLKRNVAREMYKDKIVELY